MSGSTELFSIRLKLDPAVPAENFYIKLFKLISPQKRNNYVLSLLRDIAEQDILEDNEKNSKNTKQKKRKTKEINKKTVSQKRSNNSLKGENEDDFSRKEDQALSSVIERIVGDDGVLL